MSNSFLSSAIEKTSEEQRFDIVTNIVKMLVERGVIKGQTLSRMINDFSDVPIDVFKTNEERDQHAKKIATSLLSHFKDDNTCSFTIDNPQENDSKNYKIVLLLDQKVANVTKSSVIADYLFKNQAEHKIIVVNDINTRSRHDVIMKFPLVEVFKQSELMINIVDHIFQPIFMVLSQDECKQMLEEYDIKKNRLPWIFVTDPISRYYKLTIGQIIRVYRYSETSGLAVTYRIVTREIAQKK